MARVSAYHSKLPGTLVHHIYSDCVVGNNIESYNRVAGTGGLPLCFYCKHHD